MVVNLTDDTDGGGDNDDNKPNDSSELLVGLPEGGLELGVGVDKPLDLLQGMHDEHVHQVLPGRGGGEKEGRKRGRKRGRKGEIRHTNRRK